MATNAAWRRGLSTTALILPVAVWFNDSFFSTYRIRGSSMEPALEDGDVVLVRNAVFLPVMERRRNARIARGDGSKDDLLHGTSLEDARERERIRRSDDSWGQLEGLLYTNPPTPVPGDVVIFKSPRAFPPKLHVKRVVASGGQRVRPADRYRSIEAVPSDSLWLEGDNTARSEDSCSYGAVTKRLLVGKVDRVLWPPARWGPTERKKPAPGRAWWSHDIEDEEW